MDEYFELRDARHAAPPERLVRAKMLINAKRRAAQEAERAARRYCEKQGITYSGPGFCPDHLYGGVEDAI